MLGRTPSGMPLCSRFFLKVGLNTSHAIFRIRNEVLSKLKKRGEVSNRYGPDVKILKCICQKNWIMHRVRQTHGETNRYTTSNYSVPGIQTSISLPGIQTSISRTDGYLHISFLSNIWFDPSTDLVRVDSRIIQKTEHVSHKCNHSSKGKKIKHCIFLHDAITS
jgi:hypothetical protein